MPASLTVIPWTLVEISEFLGQLPVDDDEKSQLNASIASLCSELSNDPCFLWSSEVRGGSVGLNHPKLMSSEQVRQSIITPNLRKLPYIYIWSWSSVVWRDSVGLNHHPKLMSNSTAGLVPCVMLWFKVIWVTQLNRGTPQFTFLSFFQYIFNGVLRIFNSRISESFIICTVPKEEMDTNLKLHDSCRHKT